MFNVPTLNFVMIILALVYFIMSFIIYKVRKDKYLIYYYLTFLTLSLTYLLLFYQKTLPEWLGFIVTNLLVLLSQLFVVTGVRVLYSLKPFIKSSILYFIFILIGMIYYTYVDLNINARVIIVSFALAIMLIELLHTINRNKNKVHKSITTIVIASSSISLLIWFSRIAFAIFNENSAGYLIDQGLTVGIYYFIGMITISIWFSLYIWIESTQSVISLEMKNKELSQLALIDNLTGLANRHYLEYDINFLIATSNRTGSKLSMLMIDLDRFKLVNDTYGHLVGDKVLKQTAHILSESVRSSDRIYRWGGEEFVIIVPDTSNEQAKLLAEKICQNFRDAKFDIIGNITVSIGVASFDRKEKIEDWFKRADLALYQAKQTGRNGWVVWLDNESLPIHFSRFIWNETYESGNKDIDNDHKLLANYVNNLHDLIVGQSPIDTIQQSIFEISEHIKNHFILEENIIMKKGYVDYMEHRSIHQRLLAEYEIILKKALNSDISLAALMSYLVEKVLIDHITNEDSKFFSVVK